MKDAFHRDDIGGVTIAWGDNKSGVNHIISSREKRKQDWKVICHELADVAQTGALRLDKGKFIIEKNNNRVVVSPEKAGENLTFVVTAYSTLK